jgi:WD40 repeat protein
MKGNRLHFRRGYLAVAILCDALCLLSLLALRLTFPQAAVVRGQEDTIHAFLSPDGKAVVALDASDRTARLCDATTGKERATLFVSAEHHPLRIALPPAFSPDSSTLATLAEEEGVVKLWDVSTGEEVATLRAHKDRVEVLAFSPDGLTLASAGADGTVKLWDVAARRELLTLRGHTAGVSAVAFSPDGNTVASGGWDHVVRLCDARSGQETAALKGHRMGVRRMAFSPDGKTLATAEALGMTAELWDVATASHRATLDPEQWDYVDSLSFHPGGKVLATLAGEMIEFWDVASGARTASLRHGYPSPALTLRCYFEDQDRPLKLLQTEEYLRSAEFRSDGKLVVTGVDADGKALKRWILQIGPSRTR